MNRNSIRRSALLLSAALCLVLVPSRAHAQQKVKDEVLYQYLVSQFEQLNMKVSQLDDHLKELDTQLDQLKQKESDMESGLRDAQNNSKAIDTSLNTFRLSSQQDLFGLKTDLAQTRTDIAALTDLIKRSSAASAAAVAVAPKAPDAPPTSATLEGYITAVADNEVTINLGSSAGVQPGAQFNVYKAADPRTGVGVVEVTQVIDTNNSKAKVIFSKPDAHLEFSDTVRLK